VLCELVNIGSGNALSSLARLIGNERFDLSLSELTPVERLAELIDLAAPGLAVTMRLAGPTPSVLGFLFDTDAARAVAGRLVGRENAVLRPGSDEESAVVEAVNIISCSFIGAIASVMRSVLVPAPPVVRYGELAGVLARQVADADWLLTNRFTAVFGGYGGRVVWALDDAASGRAGDLATGSGAPLGG
jgi:chemotaxis protein CheY-P-specific phosphatase CheC